LIIDIKKNISPIIGTLGKINFKKGKYVYVGSAQNNLEKRIARHLKKKKRKFWHIDYLLAKKNVKVINTYYKKAGKREECKIACLLALTEKPIKNFGNGDCRCISHLFRIVKLNKKKIKKIFEK